jgi:hypothetical protein
MNHTRALTFHIWKISANTANVIQSEPESVSTAVGTVFHFVSCTTRSYHVLQNVVRRKTQRKQGQKGCSIHSYGRRSVFFLYISLSGSFMSSALLGASGTGRTTFVNTLCESEVLSHKVSDSPETAHVEEGIRIKPANVGALHLLCHQTRFSWGLSRCLFRAGGGWRAHCPDNCGHSRIW